MKWLLHGALTPAAAEALKRHEHETRLPTDIGLPPDATPADVLRAAHKHQLDLITPDDAVAEALYQNPFPFDRSIVHLHVGAGEIEQDDAIDRLFRRYKRLTPGRLYTVTDARVKIRQLPTQRLSR